MIRNFLSMNTMNIILFITVIILFIKRTCQMLKDESALKILYYSLVRSRFDYALLIWHPYLITQIENLNTIQNNVIRFLCNQCFVYRAPHSYYNVAIRLF